VSSLTRPAPPDRGPRLEADLADQPGKLGAQGHALDRHQRGHPRPSGGPRDRLDLGRGDRLRRRDEGLAGLDHGADLGCLDAAEGTGDHQQASDDSDPELGLGLHAR
jgi:hypothetical protein